MRRGEHHLHQRKRKSSKEEDVKKYPSKDRWIYFLDKTASVVAVLMPLTAFPQVYNIWVLQQVAGVSILTWSLFLLLGIPMLIYGIVHKEPPLIILNTLWLVADVLVISGVLIYG